MPERLGPFQIAVLRAYPGGARLLNAASGAQLTGGVQALCRDDQRLRVALDAVGPWAGSADAPAAILTGMADDLEASLDRDPQQPELSHALRWLRTASLLVWEYDNVPARRSA